MSKAPEWIYLDGDVEAGDGMFPRCFENPKYASEPQVEYVRVDLAEAAEQQGYASAMEDARKLHEARIEDLEAKLAKQEALMDAGFAEYERRLAKAVEALHQIAGKKDYADDPWSIARTTLAELGEGDG